MITYITKENFKEEVLDYKGLLILDFFAVWCGPCKAEGKILESFDLKYSDKVKICKCNTDENEELATQFGIMTIPTLIFYKDGKELSKYSGVLEEEGLKRMLEI